MVRPSTLVITLCALLAGGCVRDGGATPMAGAVPAPIIHEAPAPAEGPPTLRADLATPQAPASAPAPKAESLQLTFVGDIFFGRYREHGFVPLADDPSFDPFAEIRSTLASDVVVGNLETPVVETLPAFSPVTTEHRFGATRLLVRDHLGDFHVLGLANNHALDLLEDGQRQSPRILTEEGIVPIGAARTEAPLHRLETHEIRGWRIGFLAVTTLLNVDPSRDGPHVPFVELAALPATLLPLVEQGRADHDLIVVFVHWGTEYYAAPSRRQQRVARQLIDGGVDMVIGHHPHVLQAIERRGDGLIAYSLGNFLFSGTASKPGLMGVLRATWQAAPDGAVHRESTLVDAVLHPAINEGQPSPHPVPATGARAEEVRDRVAGLSARMGTRWTRVEGSEDLRMDLGARPKQASRR